MTQEEFEVRWLGAEVIIRNYPNLRIAFDHNGNPILEDKIEPQDRIWIQVNINRKEYADWIINKNKTIEEVLDSIHELLLKDFK